MTIWEGMLLGLVQGLTEFLPVSSSGHLVLAHHVFGLKNPALFTEVMLHAGTLVAIFVVFWKDLMALGQSGLWGAAHCLTGQGRSAWQRDPNFRLLVYLALGTVPVALAGILAKEKIEALNGLPAWVGALLVVNGGMLILSRRIRKGSMTFLDLTLSAVLAVGLFQMLALLPGISRSGITILAALWLGVERDTAGRLSFLLAVPAVAGATIWELTHVVRDGLGNMALAPVLLGTVVAMISGYVAIRVLLGLVRRGRLYVFGPYCVLLGVAAVAWFW